MMINTTIINTEGMNNFVIRGNAEYSQQLINGYRHFNRIIPYVDEKELFNKDLRGSSIVECKINNETLEIKKYHTLLLYIYSNTYVETVLQNTILNISQQEIYEKDFTYYDYLKLSIQGAEARRTLKEIINMVRINNYTMRIVIKLKNGEKCCFII